MVGGGVGDDRHRGHRLHSVTSHGQPALTHGIPRTVITITPWTVFDSYPSLRAPRWPLGS